MKSGTHDLTIQGQNVQIVGGRCSLLLLCKLIYAFIPSLTYFFLAKFKRELGLHAGHCARFGGYKKKNVFPSVKDLTVRFVRQEKRLWLYSVMNAVTKNTPRVLIQTEGSQRLPGSGLWMKALNKNELNQMKVRHWSMTTTGIDSTARPSGFCWKPGVTAGKWPLLLSLSGDNNGIYHRLTHPRVVRMNMWVHVCRALRTGPVCWSVR